MSAGIPDTTISDVSWYRSAVPAIQIGPHEIGGEYGRALVIAEAGVNHNGDLLLAHRLIDASADSGADAVKFQTFSASAVVTGGGATAPYQEAAGSGTSQRSMLERLELPVTAWAELRNHAIDRELLFLSTAFDRASLELLTDLGVDAVKVPSGELTNVMYLESHAACGLPILASTGMANMEEVDAAVSILTESTAGLALFHCVSAYPTPIAASNLRAIQTMRDRHHVPVGWSDHTSGNVAAIAARALGAAMFEKHVTLDRTMVGPDHRASADPAELTAYVEAIRACESALGNGKKVPVDIEFENRRVARRSYYASRDIVEGEQLDAINIEALRPVDGVPASERLVGRTAARAIVAGAPIEWNDLA